MQQINLRITTQSDVEFGKINHQIFFFFLCGTTVILLCLKEGKYLGYTVFRIYGFSLHLVLAMQVLTETFQNNKQKNMLLENQ